VTALFSRGPWLYIRIESNGQTGYIPRIICSLYKNPMIINDKNYYHHHHLSMSSTDSSSNKDDELDLTILSTNNYKNYFIRPYQQQEINRYLSHSTAIINDQSKSKEPPKKRLAQIHIDERERRNTCTLPPPLSSTSKDRRLTLGSINWPITTKNSEATGVHQMNDVSTTTTTTTTNNNNGRQPLTRDTDSSSTQDSGYSESTPYFLVQQATPDTEQAPTVINTSKVVKHFLFFSIAIYFDKNVSYLSNVSFTNKSKSTRLEKSNELSVSIRTYLMNKFPFVDICTRNSSI
jgi:hypothetical protein